MNEGYDFAYRVLGPIFRQFCFRLRLVELYKQQTPFLFLSRGGLRLRYFYDLYLTANNLQRLAPHRDFYVSRVAAFRALLADKSDYAASKVAQEYRSLTLDSAMHHFLPTRICEQWREQGQSSAQASNQEIDKEAILDLVDGSCSQGRVFRNHVKEQFSLLTQHFSNCGGNSNEVLLVDTGWSGSIVKSLQELFPNTSMTAIFFGRFNYGDPAPPWFDSITGLILQNEFYHSKFPQSSIIFHRHLVESLCEPDWPSTEWYENHGGQAAPACGVIPEDKIAPQVGETFAEAVRDFIASEPSNSVEKIEREYRLAAKQLAKSLTFPSKRVAKLLGNRSRPGDFGRTDDVPVLVKRCSATSRIQRVMESLWRQGQVAVEYGPLRWPLQAAITWKRYRVILKDRCSRVVRQLRRAS